jgi:hypothetical protein
MKAICLINNGTSRGTIEKEVAEPASEFEYGRRPTNRQPGRDGALRAQYQIAGANSFARPRAAAKAKKRGIKRPLLS